MSWNELTKGSASTENKVNFTKFEEGITRIRALNDSPFVRWAHWIPSASRSVTCIGKGCPVCDVIRAAKANKEVPKFSQGKKFSINVLNRTTGNVEVLEQSTTFFEELHDIMTENGDITEYDIKVKRKGTDTNTSYRIDAEDKVPLTDAEIALAKEHMVNLEEYFSIPTKEQLLDLLAGKPASEVFSSSTTPVIE